VLREVAAGRMVRDRIVPAGGEGWKGLLRPVLRQGRALAGESLAGARERCRRELGSLPPALRGLPPPPAPYPVEVDPALEELLLEERRLLDARR
jgi:hypothetical protein